jgi:SAM-dependent methyltransferase
LGRLTTLKTFSSSISSRRHAQIKCNLCGADKTREYLKGQDFLFVKCRECGLVYQNPQPVISEIQNRYNQHYFRYEYENADNFFNLMLLGLKDIGYTEKKLKEWKDKTFIDIGCATGKLLAYFRDLGWKSQGVEICKESAGYARKKRGVQVFIGTLSQAQFACQSFSLIHFSHLIEHVPDPRALLEEVKRILKPDGRAVITTPNCDGLQAKLFKSNWRSAIADHLFLFSQKTLSRLLSALNFKIHNIVTWGGLAKGTAPGFIKKPVDRLAKKLGFGDVVLFEVGLS